METRIRAILLVEDDANDARLLKRAFDKARIDVPMVRVEHGDDAVSYLRGEHQFVDRTVYPMPGIVLLDLKLPRRSGFEVLAWVRRSESQCRRLPIVVLSSSDDPGDINRSYELGANSYLTKPTTTSDFHAVVSAFSRYWLDINQAPVIEQLYC